MAHFLHWICSKLSEERIYNWVYLLFYFPVGLVWWQRHASNIRDDLCLPERMILSADPMAVLCETCRARPRTLFLFLCSVAIVSLFFFRLVFEFSFSEWPPTSSESKSRLLKMWKTTIRMTLSKKSTRQMMSKRLTVKGTRVQAILKLSCSNQLMKIIKSGLKSTKRIVSFVFFTTQKALNSSS